MPDVLQTYLTMVPAAPVPGKPATLLLTVRDANGKPVTGRQVTLDLSLQGASTRRVTAHPEGQGGYRAEAVFPRSGTWDVGVRISGAGRGQPFTFKVKTR